MDAVEQPISARVDPAKRAISRECVIRRGILIALSASILVLVRGFLPTLACAAEKKAFDIPAESAEQSVRNFVEQAGLSVLYESGRLTRFQTRAVRGDFEPIEALGRCSKAAV